MSRNHTQTPHRTDFDIIQIGYGPVSKVSALLLERMGWKVGIFERWGEVYPLPRAVCIDHEVFRLLHAAGLGPIVDKVTSPAPMYRWYNADQPTLESELDAEVKRRNNIKVFFEHDFLSAKQTNDQVTIEVKDLVSEDIHQCDWQTLKKFNQRKRS